jgi:large subunit ribosomal protein L4
MAKLSIVDMNGKKVKDVTLNKEVFGIKPNDVVLYDAITLAQAANRQGTHSVKTRAEVRGGGRKPWRQKGTGRARQGSIRAPQWYKGGIVFGPQTEKNYTKKQNKKERRLALLSALSYKALNNEIVVVDSFELKTGKTKEALEVLKTLNAPKKVLIVVNELTNNVILATRNIVSVTLLETTELNVLDVISADMMIVEAKALEQIEEVLK